MDTIEQLIADIMADEQNATYTQQGIKPLFTVPKTARINIVGQAPGIRAQESGLYWNDPSGDNLRKSFLLGFPFTKTTIAATGLVP